MSSALLKTSPHGLQCAIGNFFIDPSAPVATAVVTHGHSDHARPGAGVYFCAEGSLGILRKRLGAEANIVEKRYEEPFLLGDIRLSFHPAGHILGSAQVRLEHEGIVWVVSGDYKRDPDPTCRPFAPLCCDTFITEATFGLPVYRWDPTERVAAELLAWWERNRARGRNSLLGCYALGKAQRLLAEVGRLTDRPLHTHGAVESLTEVYRASGVALPATIPVPESRDKIEGALILAPPSALASPWARRFGDADVAFASGWMRLRGNRRRRGYDRGFVLSDHADWPSLLRTVEETGAKRVLVTHGSVDILVRALRDRGIDAAPLATPYEGDGE